MDGWDVMGWLSLGGAIYRAPTVLIKRSSSWATNYSTTTPRHHKNNIRCKCSYFINFNHRLLNHLGRGILSKRFYISFGSVKLCQIDKQFTASIPEKSAFPLLLHISPISLFSMAFSKLYHESTRSWTLEVLLHQIDPSIYSLKIIFLIQAMSLKIIFSIQAMSLKIIFLIQGMSLWIMILIQARLLKFYF